MVSKQQDSKDGNILQRGRHGRGHEERFQTVADGDVSAGTDAHKFADKLSGARAENRQRKPRHVLIGAERDSQKGVNQSARRAA